MGAWELNFKGDSAPPVRPTTSPRHGRVKAQHVCCLLCARSPGDASMEQQLVDTLEKSLARDKADWERPT